MFQLSFYKYHSGGFVEKRLGEWVSGWMRGEYLGSYYYSPEKI